MTSTSSSNFDNAKVNAYIRKKTLDIGERTYYWPQFVAQERIEAGNGTTWRAVRYLRLDVPLAGLTEGTPPTEDDLEVETVEASCTQWGLTVKITDVLDLTIKSRPIQEAISKKADAMAALVDMLLCAKALEGTNVYYGGSGVTARSGLSATGADLLSTKLVRKAAAKLSSSEGGVGAAPKQKNGVLAALIHTKQVFDMQADPTWESAAIRSADGQGALREGRINRWAKCDFYESDFLPQFVNLANAESVNNTGFTAYPVIDDNTAVAGTRGMDGFTANPQSGSGSLTASTTYYFVLARRHKKRGHLEGMTSVLRVATGVSEENIVFTMPDDTEYVYTLYFGDTDSVADCFRVPNGNNLAADATVDVSAVPTSGAVAPVAPPRYVDADDGTTSEIADVFPLFVLGGQSIGSIALQDMRSYMVSGPDSGNPLDQFVIVGSKFMQGEIILQDEWFLRIESQSQFGS